MAIFHFLSFIHSYLVLSGFTSLLSSLLSPGGLYFTLPTRPQVGLAVLVSTVDWVEAAWDSVLQGSTEWGSQGRSVTVQQTKLLLMMSWNKTTEKKDKQRKNCTIHRTKLAFHIYLTCYSELWHDSVPDDLLSFF